MDDETPPLKEALQRQIPRITTAIDDLMDEGRGIIISGAVLGKGSIDLTIGKETVTVDRATLVRQISVFS